MKKTVLILIGLGFIIAAWAYFSKTQVQVSAVLGNKISDIRSDISEERNLKTVEEVIEGLDYQTIINRYSGDLKGFSVTKFKYFVVFSNLTDDLTLTLIDNDMRHTIDAMEKNYIAIDPDKVTAVFLFEDQDTYSNFAINTFNMARNDLSPYGFYKISKNVILVRYVSWKGSLAHEVTHAMIQSDFPRMPSWFNEGMGALHERATYTDGELIGDFSWRIIALRRAFSEERYTGLEDMMTTNDEELYGNRSSFYYAQSRYLLGYLQEKKLLERYYKHFNNSSETDRTGITQLETITGKTLEQIDTELIAYIQSFKE